jgi:hypothetical protein
MLVPLSVYLHLTPLLVSSSQVAQSVAEALSKDQIFDFRRSEGPCLLILDRYTQQHSPLHFYYQTGTGRRKHVRRQGGTGLTRYADCASGLLD